MSDNYRDGCSGRRYSLNWFLVQLVRLGAFLFRRM